MKNIKEVKEYGKFGKLEKHTVLIDVTPTDKEDLFSKALYSIVCANAIVESTSDIAVERIIDNSKILNRLEDAIVSLTKLSRQYEDKKKALLLEKNKSVGRAFKAEESIKGDSVSREK